MMAAAMNGALAFQKGLGGVHAMSHALGALKDYALHHGTLNAVLLPHVLEFNGPAVSHRYPDLADAMGMPAACRYRRRACQAQRATWDCHRTLAAMGVDADAIERAAPHAEKDHTNGTNPRRATASDYRELMRAAL